MTLIESESAQTDQLIRENERILSSNDEVIKQIEADAIFEIEDINKKNTQNQTQV